MEKIRQIVFTKPYTAEYLTVDEVDFDKIDAIFNQKCDYIMSLLS